MAELLTELIDKWILIYAALTVACVEAIMRKTRESITRWKYAIPATAIIAIFMSVAHSFEQDAVTWQGGLARGIKAAIVAIAMYDSLKSLCNSPKYHIRVSKAYAWTRLHCWWAGIRVCFTRQDAR